MRRNSVKRPQQAGFSLLEMLVVVAILMVVMGAVFQQVSTVQKRYRVEENKLDLTQESREFLEQISRDLHTAGYPNSKMYGGGMLNATPENDSKNAVGLVKFAYDELWFEGDVDGDGTVDVVNYKLAPDGVEGKCPCKISRSQLIKINSTAPLAQFISAQTELQDVINSGGANSGASGTAAYTIAGTSKFGTSNDSLYSTYKPLDVFTAYDGDGALVGPVDYSTAAGKLALKTIRTIRISINVMARQTDLQTGMRPVIPFVARVRIPAN
jgi:prepilin-type N-terminal cleavage/methylation domain-containing protein